jgi:hypothetical protein
MTIPKVNISDVLGRKPEKVSGVHLWTLVVAWTVIPGSGEVLLDHETLLTADGPTCFWCEHKPTPEALSAPCPGRPS